LIDTRSDASTTDTLGRRTGPRQKHTIEEKRRIVLETHVKGTSVATVARLHGVNANQVFAWRQLYRRGLLEVNGATDAPSMLPVKVTTPTVLPTERRGERAGLKDPARQRQVGSIEIDLPNGRCIRVHGQVDTKLLARVIDVLVRR
jgi:transposase